MKKNTKPYEKANKDLKQRIVFLCSTVLVIIYLLWRLFFTMPWGEGIPQMVFAILLITAEIITSFTTFELYWRKTKAESRVLSFPVIPDEEYPDIDVFIATHNEPESILLKTASACTYMDYPDKSKVHIYFCDDGFREEVHRLADRLGIGYIGLQNNKHAKSGNLNNALAHSSSPLIATFDADMIPMRTFLMDTVPYFFVSKYIKDEKTGLWRPRTPEEKYDDLPLGLVQTPQSFYNLDLFQYNLYVNEQVPNEQDFFSREVNQMRNSSNACAYTGSNTIILRKALEDIGGFPYHTITEDFETSCRLQMAGYLTYAAYKVEAHGLTTQDVPSMMRQRVRWARGVIQSIRNTNAIFSRKLPISARITYLNAFLYWWSFFNRVIFVLAPIMFALFDFRVVDCELWQLLIFWLPSYFFYSQSMKFLSSNVRSEKWSQIIDTILAPALIFPVFLETFGISEKKFKVTRKDKTTKSTGGLGYVWLPLTLAVLSVLAIIRFVRGKYGVALLYGSVIIYWLCYNLIALIYAINFMLGRNMYRQTERIDIVEKAVLNFGTSSVSCLTKNLSDTGAMFEVSGALDTVPQTFRAAIMTDLYEARLNCTLIRTFKKDKKTYISVQVSPESLHDRREYVQIIYDRDPGITKNINPWNTTYDDLLRILTTWLNSIINRLKSLKGGKKG